MKNKHLGNSWNEVRKEIFTKDEIRESDFRVSLIEEFIKARYESGLTQKELEKLSGISQPVIARLERGTTSPQLDTVVRLLATMGKKLEVVSIKELR